MGKKDKTCLGRSLIKDRFGSSKGKKFVADNSMLHTTEVQDGYDWNRINLNSVTEESSFQEFLSTAELTGTEFQAEKLNIKFVNPRSHVGLLTGAELKKTKENQEKHREFLKIPRRPAWNSNMSREELDHNEKEYFIEWRRCLSKLQEEEGLLLTPYEKNLEFWRQLWRVVERSDVVIQIVDARNPLLFRCEDLEHYVKEVSDNKMNLILVNKSDFLTEEQRQSWCDYFTDLGINVIFYSAVQNSDTDKEDEKVEITNPDLLPLKENIDNLEKSVEVIAQKLDAILEQASASSQIDTFTNSSKILTKDELVDLFRTIYKGPKVTENTTTIGLVGYPNVGKSSTINSLFTSKKVSVSATPGKTKHFQTLFLDKEIILCDCPGLVMPSFVFTKAEMILNGILPIDQMRDHVPPINLISTLIPRHVIEDKYGIMLPMPMEGEDPDRSPTAEELLNAYGYNRGFMTANGQPDNPRAARYILKDFMNGKLLYCHAPPNVSQNDFHKWEDRQKIRSLTNVQPPRQVRAVKPNRVTSEDVDNLFFQGPNRGAHIKGKILIPNAIASSGDGLGAKPWKKINKHENKNKKEKLRRVYAHLDQH